ncbi:MAG: hypothetical protein ACI87E_001416 [Mariniblastus sp.]|jgi:hypothetical protein
MAKKKVAVRKVAKKTPASSAKSASSKSNVGKRINRTKGKATTKAKPTRQAESMSVDSVLKKFKKERLALDTLSVSLRKKIEDFDAKAKSLQAQVVELSEQEVVTREAIEQLDDRRDAEVRSLLMELGVKISAPELDASGDKPPQASKPKRSSANDPKAKESKTSKTKTSKTKVVKPKLDPADSDSSLDQATDAVRDEPRDKPRDNGPDLFGGMGVDDSDDESSLHPAAKG